ncbi:MAG: hypothetical protein HYV27_07075 [Candidatus Hydrogenedentes bacterium]|nr:hypothetical protein [Candidatus Hydrogenedentota bacterium]
MIVNGGTGAARIEASAGPAGLNAVYYSGAIEDAAALEDGLVRAGKTRRVQGIYNADGRHWAIVNRAAQRLGLGGAGALNGVTPMVLAASSVPHLPFSLAGDSSAALFEAGPYPLWVHGNLAPGFNASAVVDAEEELGLALRMVFRRANEALVQTASAGATISVFGFKRGREFLAIDAVGVTMQPKGFRMPLGYTFPAPLRGGAYGTCMDLAHAAARALPPCHALLEVEIVAEGKDFLVSGLWIHHELPAPLRVLFREGLGIDLSAEWMRVLCGLPPRLNARRNLGVAIGWFLCRSGVVQGIKGLEKAGALPGLVSIVIPAKKGDVVRHCVDLESRDRHGYAVCTGACRESAAERLRAVHEAIRIDTNPYLD